MVIKILDIFKRKSAKDISILTYSLVLISVIFWFLYGLLELKNLPMILGSGTAIIGVSFIVVGWFLYGKELKIK